MNITDYYIRDILKDNISHICLLVQDHYDDKIEVVLTKSIYSYDETPLQIRSVILNKEPAINIVKLIHKKLTQYGYKENFNELNKFNTFEDGTIKPSFVFNTIEQEELEYPFSLQAKENAILHYNGNVRDRFGRIINNNNIETICKEIYSKINRPFDFVIREDGLQIIDVMVDSTYQDRKHLIKHLDVDKVDSVKEYFIEDEEDFYKAVNYITDLGYNKAIVNYPDSMYIPSGNKSNSFILDLLDTEYNVETTTITETEDIIDEQDQEVFVEKLFENYI